MTKVLITGAGGFIARRLAVTLQQAGMETVGTSRRARSIGGFRHISQACLGDSLVPILEAEEVDAVIHTALDTGPNADATNVAGTTRWLEEAAAAGVGLQVFLSSLSAEPTALAGYGRAKYELEQAFVAGGQVVLRLGLVIGNGGLFARMVETSRRSPVVPMLDNGRQLIYVLGIDLLCRVLRDCIVGRGHGLRGRSWNIQQPQPYTLRQVLQSINRQYGYRAVLVPLPARPVLSALQLAERLPVPSLPISSTNVKGLIQQGRRHIPSDFSHFGYPEESLDLLIARAAQVCILSDSPSTGEGSVHSTPHEDCRRS